MSHGPERKQSKVPPEATATGVEKTTPGPKDAAVPPTDNLRNWTEASPAEQVSESDDPDTEASRRAMAMVSDERVPVVEPAHDMTGLQVIDPVWVYSGYWGPLDEDRHPAILALRAAFPDDVSGVTFFRDEVTVHVNAERLPDMCRLLRDHEDLSYRLLSDLTAVDMLNLRREPRFDLCVTLYSIKNRVRLRLKAGVAEDQPVPTLTTVFAAAGWLEREAYDMFGITFAGHPDLRRMLLPEDWDEGHPMRKDYPIRGYKQYLQPGFDHPAPRVHSERSS